MGVTVCLLASTIHYPEGGGHMWVYLNWALGLRALGCQVIWLEIIHPRANADQVWPQFTALKTRLERYGFEECVALWSSSSNLLLPAMTEECLDLDAASEAELLLNFRYATRPEVVRRFRRSAMVDIDPGLLQLWISAGKLDVAPHDVYFTIGETVGQSGARFPDAGLTWHYTPPCVALDWWPVRRVPAGAPFTTVSHWTMGEWMLDGDEVYSNDKRTGFLPFLDLPKHTSQPLELALCLAPDEEDERVMLQKRGWRVGDAWELTSTPWDYQRYIQDSRGEFSCVKPSCIRLQNAWISDRTLCYLASGKPAVVQHTGLSRFLPDADGLFRFRDLDEAAQALATVGSDYEQHCQRARALAEEVFDAQKVVGRVLERALG